MMVTATNGSRLPIGHNKLLVMQTAQIDGTCDTSHQTIRAGDWLVREVATSLDQPPSAKADGLPITALTVWASGLVDFSPLPKPFGSDSIVFWHGAGC
jgi:hypothetical protein